jgi:hypothetical protein
MQTIKPRAKWLKGGTCQLWELSHPDAGVLLWSALPHDGAKCLLIDWVLPRLTERLVGVDVARKHHELRTVDA